MNTIANFKQMLFSNWHFVRSFRLGIGLFIGYQALQLHDSLSGFIAAFFLFQAVTNTGCCGASGCALPNPPKDVKAVEVKFKDIEYRPK